MLGSDRQCDRMSSVCRFTVWLQLSALRRSSAGMAVVSFIVADRLTLPAAAAIPGKVCRIDARSRIRASASMLRRRNFLLWRFEAAPLTAEATVMAAPCAASLRANRRPLVQISRRPEGQGKHRSLLGHRSCTTLQAWSKRAAGPALGAARDPYLCASCDRAVSTRRPISSRAHPRQRRRCRRRAAP